METGSEVETKNEMEKEDRDLQSSKTLDCGRISLPNFKKGSWLEGAHIDVFCQKTLFRFRNETDRFSFASAEVYRTIAVSEKLPDFLDWGLSHCKELASKATSFFIIVNTAPTGGGLHWILGLVDFSSQTIFVIDSMLKEEVASYECIFRNLFKIVIIRSIIHSTGFSFADWTFSLSKDWSDQKDGYSCGMRVCLNVYSIVSREDRTNFKGSESIKFIKEILQSEAEIEGNLSPMEEPIKNQIKETINQHTNSIIIINQTETKPLFF